MTRHLTKKQVAAKLIAAFGGAGAGRRISEMAGITRTAGYNWLDLGVPPARLPLAVAVSGLPAHIIRPDLIAPPIPFTQGSPVTAQEAQALLEAVSDA